MTVARLFLSGFSPITLPGGGRAGDSPTVRLCRRLARRLPYFR